MVDYNAPKKDYDFLLNEVLDAIPIVQRLGYSEFDKDFLSMLNEGWGEHVKEVWLPINQLGDRVGLNFNNGKISMPEEFKKAYKESSEAGWLSTACKPEHGGMGVPIFFQSVIWAEFGTSANMALSVLPALTVGVYEVLVEHGEKELVDYFAKNIATR